MRRNIAKYIDHYDWLNKKNKAGAFYLSDYIQLVRLSSSRANPNNFNFELSGNALKVGYIVGYNRALADVRKKEKSSDIGTAATDDVKTLDDTNRVKRLSSTSS